MAPVASRKGTASSSSGATPCQHRGQRSRPRVSNATVAAVEMKGSQTWMADGWWLNGGLMVDEWAGEWVD